MEAAATMTDLTTTTSPLGQRKGMELILWFFFHLKNSSSDDPICQNGYVCYKFYTAISIWAVYTLWVTLVVKKYQSLYSYKLQNQIFLTHNRPNWWHFAPGGFAYQTGALSNFRVPRYLSLSHILWKDQAVSNPNSTLRLCIQIVQISLNPLVCHCPFWHSLPTVHTLLHLDLKSLHLAQWNRQGLDLIEVFWTVLFLEFD